MDERAALAMIGTRLPGAGDDCAVVDGQVLTTDMLHETTDFPDGTTRYTAGWRAVGASLSDVAAMGADATAAVAVYGAPTFEADALTAFVEGASEVCEAVGAEYVGGDLDGHDEFTVATTGLGRTDEPVLRSGATVGDVVCVTGTLGRSGAGLRLFERGDDERANELFRFEPRVEAGTALSGIATAMMDSSDGLARSLHQLAGASDCGMAVETPLPIDDSVDDVADGSDERLELGAFFGEDFELVCTVPEDEVERARTATPCPLTPIGTVTEAGVTLDGESLPDRGYSH
ncbi:MULTISPECIES: thiamine-phosphate kinase [Halomicrobium]|uniref:Thiamine-monophosphate kinase n=2 Tax=Halomicrobium mukohataei TaxID=57705 RepID=C7P2U6_HALMD|nr:MULTISPECIES: thiamine-phosphate kinase [Halomicrobium]ACV47418.1 thiamine-monophosphate kinase [Halomicrobium mukohataei DSM 12286]QCD65882.1 thiamine-phosphate kinase [Halomicrobium mukohataei]QFR20687.1 thiamine-phosphate kinase [Halomicrobium sp. ZPS1]